MDGSAQSPQEMFGSFVQIGVVVGDLDQSMAHLSEIFGIGPFRVTDWPPAGREMNRVYYGEPGDFTARMAFAELGPIELELIQPLTGRSIWADFLAQHGPGIHHIRFNVPEVGPVVDYLAGHDIAGLPTGLWACVRAPSGRTSPRKISLASPSRS